MHINKIYFFIYLYLPTCFGLICESSGRHKKYKKYMDNYTNYIIKSPNFIIYFVHLFVYLLFLYHTLVVVTEATETCRGIHKYMTKYILLVCICGFSAWYKYSLMHGYDTYKGWCLTGSIVGALYHKL